MPSQAQIDAAAARIGAAWKAARAWGYARTFLAADGSPRWLWRVAELVLPRGWVRRAAYRRTFGASEPRLPRHVEIVLADLRDYCRAETSTFDLDPRVSNVLSGRRDVWLRIQGHLLLSPEQVNRMVEVEHD